MTKQRILGALDRAGLSVFEPAVRLAFGEAPGEQFRAIARLWGAPFVAFLAFLIVWHFASGAIVTKYGTLPTPGQVYAEGKALVADHFASRRAEETFYEERRAEAEAIRKEAVTLREKAATAAGPARASLERKAQVAETRAQRIEARRYSASPTYLDQIWTSLETVFTGFLIATLIAIPVGILCGASPLIRVALTPIIQVFKPVSPLAWLPIVMIVVGAVYTTDPSEAWFEKSFITSAITVALCSLWPTLLNTALGVASTDKDYLNVARALNLSWWTKIRKVIIPSALPYIFAGLRISLGVGWMVLIASEMLAQNPGLGKFVWDMFQNGSSKTLAQIMVAVFTIGIVGFMLDRVMIGLEKAVSWGGTTTAM